MHTFRESKTQYLRDVMREACGVVAVAAEIAGTNRTYFYRVLKRYDVPFTTPAEPPTGCVLGTFREARARYLREVLTEAGTVAAAARLAGRNRTSFYRALKVYDVALPDRACNQYGNRGSPTWRALG